MRYILRKGMDEGIALVHLSITTLLTEAGRRFPQRFAAPGYLAHIRTYTSSSMHHKPNPKENEKTGNVDYRGIHL